MPINPSILLGVQYPPPPPSAGEAEERRLRIGDMIQSRELRGMQLADARQRLADEAAERRQRQILDSGYVFDEEGSLDTPGTKVRIGELMRSGALSPAVGYGAATALDEQERKRKIQEQEDKLRAFDLQSKTVAAGLGLVKGMVDPASYRRNRQAGIEQGLFTAEDWPEEEFDTAVLQRKDALLAQGLTAERMLSRERQSTLDAQNRLKAELDLVGRFGPETDTPEELRSLREMITSPELLGMIPEVYDPATTTKTLTNLGKSDAMRLKEMELGRPDISVTETELAIAATDPGRPPEQRAAADAALRRLSQHSAGKRTPGKSAPATYDPTPLPPSWKPGDLDQAALEKYPPDAQRLARQLVEYKIPFPSGTAARTEPWVSAIQAAGELDPTWTASEYQSRLGVRRAFTSGKEAAGIRAINTAVGHLNSLKTAGEKLGNVGWSRKVNELKNWWMTETGSPEVRKFKTAAVALENELATVFKQTGATDQEIKAWRENISTADSPEQLTGFIDQAWDLLTSRLAALRATYDQGMGKPYEFMIIEPRNRDLLLKMGFKPDEADPVPGRSAAGGGEAEIDLSQFEIP